MAQPKDLASYPTAFHRIADNASELSEPFRMECRSPNEAIRLRMLWYGFLRSIRAHIEAGNDFKVKDARGAEHYPLRELLDRGRGIRVSIEGEAKTTLSFVGREFTSEAVVLDEIATGIEKQLQAQKEREEQEMQQVLADAGDQYASYASKPGD